MSHRSLLQTIGQHPAAVLLVLIVVLLGGAEFTTRQLVIPRSKIERRTSQELADARALRTSRTNSVLVVGNSLLLHALNFEAAGRALPSTTRAQRLVVEQTDFWDWWYGLQKLWRDGATPSAVVVMLDPGQFVSDATRGDYSAWRLFDARDVYALSQRTRMHPTEMTRMMFSHFSAYYGFRGEFRKVVLGKVVPGVPQLMLELVPRHVSAFDSAAFMATAAARMQLLSDEARNRGIPIIVAIPPLRSSGVQVTMIARAASREGIYVILPSQGTSYREEDFLDGYHMSPSGAARFTLEFARQLDSLLKIPR